MDKAGLAAALGEVLDAPDGSVTDLHRLTGGASRETWAATVDGAAVVLQRERPGTPRAGRMGIEGGLIEAAAAAGVPVPNVVARGGEESPLGAGYLVSEFIDAETIARRILRDDRFATARSRFASDCGRALARIHDIDPTGHDIPTQDPFEAVVEMYEMVDVPVPTFDLALRWLAENRPAGADQPARFVHGDFRLGNLMIDDEGLQAVIDWELAHAGDPIGDLGWLCTRSWRFGGPGVVGGIGDVDDLVASYEAESGRSVDRAHLRWHEVLGSLRWGIMCIVQARAHLDGHARSVELAAIGRRVVENEYDLYLLLAPGAVDAAAVELDAVGVAEPEPLPSLWPPAHEMLLAAEEFSAGLRDSVGGAVGFSGRVVENVMAMLRRELAQGSSAQARTMHRRREWATAQGSDWVLGDDTLAAALADSTADATDADLVALMVTWTLDRLRIVNPKYAEAPHRGR